MAAFDPELLEQAADAISTEDCARHFAAHSGRTGLRAEKRYFEENREVCVPRRTPIWQKSEGRRRFQLPPRQPAEPPCRLPCKNQLLLHITSTDLPLLDFCRSHGILVETYFPLPTAKPSRTPPFRKWRKNTAPPAQLAPLRSGAGRGCPPKNRKFPPPHGGQRQGGLFHFL